jgi:hypothetical protein
MSGRRPHWLDEGAILIVVRDSPLDAIARDASRLGFERPVAVAGIDYDVVGVKWLPTDPRCTRIRLRRQGSGVTAGGAAGLFTAEFAEMSSHETER